LVTAIHVLPLTPQLGTLAYVSELHRTGVPQVLSSFLAVTSIKGGTCQKIFLLLMTARRSEN